MKKSYYAVIPADVRYDKDLPMGARLLYGELTALSNEKGYCWATNGYFADLYEVTRTTISNWVTALEEGGYIGRELVFHENSKEVKERRIHIHPPQKILGPPPKNFGDLPKKIWGPSPKKFGDPPQKIFKDNNTLNNTLNTTANSPPADTVHILTPDENNFMQALAQIDKYPLNRERDLKMYHTLRERYPELNLVEAAQQWAAYKLDKPLRDNSNPRSQINTAFRNYLKWGKCLRKEEGDARVSGDTKRQFEDDRYASYFV